MWIIRQNTESIVQTCIIILLAGYKLNLPFNAESYRLDIIFSGIWVIMEVSDGKKEERTCSL